jgi:hypothetical protein
MKTSTQAYRELKAASLALPIACADFGTAAFAQDADHKCVIPLREFQQVCLGGNETETRWKNASDRKTEQTRSGRPRGISSSLDRRALIRPREIRSNGSRLAPGIQPEPFGPVLIPLARLCSIRIPSETCGEYNRDKAPAVFSAGEL